MESPILKPIHQTTVVVGMSGGVDSSVTAALLKEKGYRVIGLFMKNWEEKDENGVCTSEADYQDVVRVCEKLDIPYYSVEFVKEYWDRVFKDFVAEYAKGYTPNPDILCNREIKFHAFLDKAKQFGADFLATGHYCRKITSPDGKHFSLAKGLDAGKDQTYFVYTLNQDILKQVLFPVGDLQKSEVRAIAARLDLATKAKKDSTGICFIGERNFREFLSKYVAAKPGQFKTLAGEIVGRHRGAAFYTPGQRRGLGLGGEGAPWFVVGKDVEKNIVWVERGETHPALFADTLWATEMSWVGDRELKFPMRVKAKIRYRQGDQDCVVKWDGDRLRVDFDVPQRAIAVRQSVVFYEGEVCLGGAIIDQVGQTYYERGQRTGMTFSIDPSREPLEQPIEA
ncbi:MAG: tRNA 2-thiouridine(34) synthase MnmA [Bdellovibrionales bacterium]|nr:tRNA 2-thiouridine(34) synthase MnmA [Bdellovibrionales bacterium]